MIFVEMRAFTRRREEVLDDESFRLLQALLIENPLAGVEIRGTGGLRKLRWATAGQGKRGGLRVIYAPLLKLAKILLVWVYQKNEQEDLTPEQKRMLRAVLAQEIARLGGAR
jgi:hypothetical protein